MTSREKILAAVFNAQPSGNVFSDQETPQEISGDKEEKFRTVLQSIGGISYLVNRWAELNEHFQKEFKDYNRIISTIPEVGLNHNADWTHADPRKLENVDVAVIPAHFGVAENASAWVTEELIHHRILPFICQHLVIVINRSDIVDNMHEAYSKIGDKNYNFGTFIAGPSKTADIEQSLVVGAHGPKSLRVYILKTTNESR